MQNERSDELPTRHLLSGHPGRRVTFDDPSKLPHVEACQLRQETSCGPNLKITVENLIEKPLLLTKEVEVIPEIAAAQKKMGLHLNPDGYRPVYDSMEDLNPKEDREELLEKLFGKIEEDNIRL